MAAIWSWFCWSSIMRTLDPPYVPHDLPGGRYPTEPLTLPDSIQAAMADARKLLGDLHQILSIMQQRDQEGTPEYQKLLELAQELHERMEEARWHQDAAKQTD